MKVQYKFDKRELETLLKEKLGVDDSAKVSWNIQADRDMRDQTTGSHTVEVCVEIESKVPVKEVTR